VLEHPFSRFFTTRQLRKSTFIDKAVESFYGLFELSSILERITDNMTLRLSKKPSFFYTRKEVMELLRLPSTTLWRYIKTVPGFPQPVRFTPSGKPCFPASAVDAYVADLVGGAA
jgi:predicted DNA-binding transcriptional regulator AlpA